MQHLFSTAYIPVATADNGETKMSVPTFAELDSAGINLGDPCGWRRRDKGSCGVAVASYMKNREGRTESLLDSMGEMLKEYFLRVEAVESFVYMDCVGIQLEKHFSQNRASALAGKFLIILGTFFVCLLVCTCLNSLVFIAFIFKLQHSKRKRISPPQLTSQQGKRCRCWSMNCKPS